MRKGDGNSGQQSSNQTFSQMQKTVVEGKKGTKRKYFKQPLLNCPLAYLLNDA